MSNNVVNLYNSCESNVFFRVERGLWGEIHDDTFNLANTPLQSHLKRHFYITTPNGVKRNLHVPEEPIFGVILPRRYTNFFDSDNIEAFILHNVEDIKDLGLDSNYNTRLSNRRELNEIPFYESISLKNSSTTLDDVVLHARFTNHQDAVQEFLSQRGYSADAFFFDTRGT